jgi:NhaP-type Na+/H+ or K+/H+ antiporter
MKAVGYIACIVGGVVLGYLLLSLGVVDAVDGVPGTLQEPAIAMPTYLGFMSAMMTAVTAVLAAVAIGIGIVAAYTFREIKDEALKAASKKVNELVSEKLSDEAIKARIDEIAFAQGPKGELDEDFDPDDTGER